MTFMEAVANHQKAVLHLHKAQDNYEQGIQDLFTLKKHVMACEHDVAVAEKQMQDAAREDFFAPRTVQG